MGLHRMIAKFKDDVFHHSDDDGHVMIIDLMGKDEMLVLDRFAAEIWKEIDGKRPLREIIRIVRSRHKKLPARFEKRCLRLYKELQSKGLIEIHED